MRPAYSDMGSSGTVGLLHARFTLIVVLVVITAGNEPAFYFFFELSVRHPDEEWRRCKIH